MKTAPAPLFAVSLLRLPQVMEQTGLSRSEIYRRVAAGRFPRPTKLGHASAWSSIEVTMWVEARLNERDLSGGDG